MRLLQLTTYGALLGLLALASQEKATSCSSQEDCIALYNRVMNVLGEPWLSIMASLHLEYSILRHPVDVAWGADTPTKWCPENAAYEFIPATAATLASSQGSLVNWTSTDGCFRSVTAEVLSVSLASSLDRTLRVRMTGEAPTGSCSALYAVGTSFHLHVVELSAGSKASATVELNVTSPEAWADVTVNGLAVFLLPCGTAGTLASVLATADLFVGSKNATAAANAAMLTYRGVWPPLTPFEKNVAVDPSIVPSGTYLAIMEFTGTDAMQVSARGLGWLCFLSSDVACTERSRRLWAQARVARGTRQSPCGATTPFSSPSRRTT